MRALTASRFLFPPNTRMQYVELHLYTFKLLLLMVMDALDGCLFLDWLIGCSYKHWFMWMLKKDEEN